jgi:hypothetical protein
MSPVAMPVATPTSVVLPNNNYPINLDDYENPTNAITLLVSEIIDEDISKTGEDAVNRLLVKKEDAANKLVENIIEKINKAQPDLFRRVLVNSHYNMVQEDRFKILNKIRKNCIKHSAYHNHRYHLYKNVLFTCFRVPLILLSGINSFSSVGLQPYLEQSYISLITAMISLFCGILTSIELLINLQKRMELELESYKEYSKISVDIYVQLQRAPADRGEKGDIGKFLLEKYNEYKILSARSNGVNMGERNFVDEFELNDIDENENAFADIHTTESTIIPDYGTSRCIMCPPCCKLTFLSCIQTIYHCCCDGLIEQENILKRPHDHSHIKGRSSSSFKHVVKYEV